MTYRRDPRQERAGRPRRRPATPKTIGPDRLNDQDVASRIRDLEERLDRMITDRARQREREEPDGGTSLDHRRELPAASSMASFTPIEPVSDATHDASSTDFTLRKWGRLGLRDREEDVDEFGQDPVYEQKLGPLFDFLYERYFRASVFGIEHVPSEGRCLLVANHSGTLPLDGMMLRQAVRREHPLHREVRWLAEDAVFHFPFLGTLTNRIGAVRACQENAERLLDSDALVAVFPEGMKGIGKLYRERYKLQRFGRGGFVKLCLRTQTQVVPVAIIGSEETNPLLARIDRFATAIGVPYVPVTPTFPLLGPLGLVPAPTKWKIYFGPAIDFGNYGAQSADDEILVGRLAERVRGEIQTMLERRLAERRSVWFG